jgi:hypothetical protein
MKPKDDILTRVLRDTAEKISGSDIFIALFHQDMAEEPGPLLQMGLAVYLDKPVYLLVPLSRVAALNRNLERLAQVIETYDGSLPFLERERSLQAATTRMLAHAGLVKP